MERARKLCSTWIMREDDTPQDRSMKMLMTPVVNVTLILSLFVLMRVLFFLHDYFYAASVTGLIVFSLLYILAGLAGCDMGKVIDVTLCGVSLTILVIDVENMAELASPIWNFVVVILDAALVFERNHIIPFIMSCTMVFHVVERTEAAFRFGIYDFTDPGMSICDCPNPPCAIGVGPSSTGLLARVLVLTLDFHLTQGFARDHRLQLRKVKASVVAAAEVAAALARYDVDTAEAVITEEEGLEEELAESFLQLLSNLRSYKPFLPHSCLVPGDVFDDAEPFEEANPA
eukprot:Hpha_TRINITY_DN10380_c0_g1::TRINITY_DN10380_c0_g1_i1::g.116209::m.116209